jgi:hypothetical protein
MKSYLSLASVCLVASALIGCSSSEKKEDASAAAPATPRSHAVTSEDITAKYSITELNSAANLLKVVIDEAGVKPNDDKGSDIIGCPLTGKQAGTMTMPIKSLIDQVAHAETESYTNDPKNYATEKGFETCAANCACGVLSDIVENAEDSAVPAASAKLHARNKQHLSVKASHQTSRDSVACARKQSWFCGSDLLSYLQKDAAKNAQ